jgi:hypothetical protein
MGAKWGGKQHDVSEEGDSIHENFQSTQEERPNDTAAFSLERQCCESRLSVDFSARMIARGSEQPCRPALLSSAPTAPSANLRLAPLPRQSHKRRLGKAWVWFVRGPGS